ncbi:MAG: YpmS family protein [Bacillota bacterium]|nr:YpmS family protein [Bacillota bacterium]
MKNKWRASFILLAGFNLAILLLLAVYLFYPSKSSEEEQKSLPKNEYVTFDVKSNKEDINQLINQYLKKEASKSPIKYEIKLADEVELYGILPFFNRHLNLKLTFEPKALANGDLLLTQKTISLGQLYLPVPYVLKFIADNYTLPRGVEIRPIDRQIYISMQQLKLKSDTKVKISTFNLKSNNVSFKLLVPIK